MTGAAFQSRVASVQGGTDYLKLLGFDFVPGGEGGQTLFLPAEKVSKDTLNVAGAELNNALTNPFFGVL